MNSLPQDAADRPMLEVDHLKVYFESIHGILRKRRFTVKAVDDVSFGIDRGSTVGLVGESGSGKSTIGRAIIRLVKPTAEEIRLEGRRIDDLPEARFLGVRKRIQMIFQDPYNSLDPRMTVGDIIAEPLMIHFSHLSRRERETRIRELLERVGLSGSFANRFPHQFSGGQRQRISIARALSVEPELIICDEAVSALDVSVQAQIVNLLQDLQQQFELTYLFIAHDLAVVSHISDYILVMENGRLMEQGPADSLYRNPRVAYTQRLLEAVPKMPTLVARTRKLK